MILVLGQDLSTEHLLFYFCYFPSLFTINNSPYRRPFHQIFTVDLSQLSLFNFQWLKQRTALRIFIISYLMRMTEDSKKSNQDPLIQPETDFNIQTDFELSSFTFEPNAQIVSFDDNQLIDLHVIHGNKWKAISRYFADRRDDSSIKNHFYSLLRRSLRKVNSYMKMKNQSQNNKNRLLKLNFVFKLTNLAESERNGISNNSNYKNLLYQFLSLKNQMLQRIRSTQDSQLNFFQNVQDLQIEKLIRSLRDIELLFQQLNLNKKGKSKKKCPKKLLLKKDQIQKSMQDRQLEHQQSKQKQSSEDSKNYQFQTPQILSPILIYGPIVDQEEELRFFDLEESCLNTQIPIMEMQNAFDPILFN